mmetsp:Transcript_41500/g.114223  ORF Transcript_41500/g.114223 Transcript_41500/m.114223 type:complete len:227 (+) Transcript_41500:94-774(+)
MLRRRSPARASRTRTATTACAPAKRRARSPAQQIVYRIERRMRAAARAASSDAIWAARRRGAALWAVCRAHQRAPRDVLCRLAGRLRVDALRRLEPVVVLAASRVLGPVEQHAERLLAARLVGAQRRQRLLVRLVHIRRALAVDGRRPLLELDLLVDVAVVGRAADAGADRVRQAEVEHHKGREHRRHRDGDGGDAVVEGRSLTTSLTKATDATKQSVVKSCRGPR